MICGVLKKGLYFAGLTVSVLMCLGALIGLLIAYSTTPPLSIQPGELCIAFALALGVGGVAHELGHLLACLAVRAEVNTFRIGSEHAAIRFRVRKVQVVLGWPYQGCVQYGGAPSLGRRVVITLAGSLMDLVIAGLLAASLKIAVFPQGARPLVVVAAVGIGVTGLVNLMPFRNRSGRLSDGARLFELRSDVRAAEAHDTAAELRRAGRTSELLKLHAGLEIPERRINVAQAVRFTLVEFNVAMLADLPREDAALAERRVTLLLRYGDLGRGEPIAYVTMALLRLRLGGPGSYAKAEQFCEQALAVKDMPDRMRRTVLGVVIVSRRARGLPYDDVRTTAAALKTPNGGPETVAASLMVVLGPEVFLEAFRAGDAGTRLAIGTLAAVLRRQGRIGDLLELHKAFKLPEGGFAAEQARSMHEVGCNLLLTQGVRREEVDEVASRVMWILGNYPFAAEGGSMPLAAVEHTLALARLRQGRFEEVEPLCASGLAGDYGPDARATILATIVLARRALGLPQADLLDEAVALSLDADLVAEAALGTAHEPAAGLCAATPVSDL